MKAARFAARGLLAATLALAPCCGDGDAPIEPEGTGVVAAPGAASLAVAADPPTPPARFFRESAAAWGLDAPHHAPRSEARYMPEIVGSGAAIADFDGDGRLDVYLVNQAALGEEAAPAAGNRLFLQRERGRFTDRSEVSGAADRGFGMGCAAADYDGDGDVDLYVTNLGKNRLFRNRGDGVFDDVTDEAGVGDERWSTSAVFVDVDGDGDLDLFVLGYVDWTLAKNVVCKQAGVTAYCAPQVYDPVPNTLYRNDGDGRFTDVSAASGIGAAAGKGLGIAVEDFDGDGRLDLYVANDGVANFLFRGLGEGRFEEIGLVSGTAYSEAGMAEAGMGTDATDLDGDGLPDLLVTNLENEMNNVFRNLGDLFFEESARRVGFGTVSRPYVGFGCRAFDHDLDGDEDVYVANGHIIDNVAEIDATKSFAQRDFLFLNDGRGRFEEVLAATDEAPVRAGRGLAVGDLDDDGDPDLLVTNNGQAPMLLINAQRSGHHFLGLTLVGRAPATAACGALVEVTVAGRTRSLRHVPRGSYLSAHDPRMLIGLGAAAAIENLVVRWPDGEVQELGALAVDRYWRIEQGRPPR